MKPQLAIVTELLSNGSIYHIMNRESVIEWEVVIKLLTEAAKYVSSSFLQVFIEISV
jgi:hypothetical protein